MRDRRELFDGDQVGRSGRSAFREIGALAALLTGAIRRTLVIAIRHCPKINRPYVIDCDTFNPVVRIDPSRRTISTSSGAAIDTAFVIAVPVCPIGFCFHAACCQQDPAPGLQALRRDHGTDRQAAERSALSGSPGISLLQLQSRRLRRSVTEGLPDRGRLHYNLGN